METGNISGGRLSNIAEAKAGFGTHGTVCSHPDFGRGTVGWNNKIVTFRTSSWTHQRWWGCSCHCPLAPWCKHPLGWQRWVCWRSWHVEDRFSWWNCRNFHPVYPVPGCTDIEHFVIDFVQEYVVHNVQDASLFSDLSKFITTGRIGVFLLGDSEEELF